MDKWHNKVAVVTGASAGIGAACCKYLINNGMIVIGLARRQERVEALRAELKNDEQRNRLHAIKCDVTEETDIIDAFATIESKYGPVAVLINNAGVVRETELLRENNSEDLRAIINTNVLGVAFCTREAFRSMSKSKIDGHVIIINSIAGHKVIFNENYQPNIYPASKHAITAMTEVYRNELRVKNTKVKVTSISPGLVNTEIFTDKMKNVLEQYPQLQSEDIADAVIYCLSTPPHVQIHELTIKPVGEFF